MQMRALVKTAPGPGLSLEEVPEPAPGVGEVKIQIRKMAICGTDLHIYQWDEWAASHVPVPIVIGHEFRGVIAEVGDGVAGFQVGQRVTGEGHITCGTCRNCRAGRREYCRNHISVGVSRPGAFAEYLVIPAENAYMVPSHISDDTAAILDPLGNATHTALNFDVVGEDVLITGAGPIGVMAVAIARHVGARFIVVTDTNDYRLELASAMGADLVVNVSRDSIEPVMSQLGMTEGFDVGFEMSGAEKALDQTLATINHGGKIAILGIPSGAMRLDMNDIVFKGLAIQGIYGRRIFDTWYKMASMLQSGLDISAVITHRYPVEQFEQAFATLGTGLSGKVLLEWSQPPQMASN